MLRPCFLVVDREHSASLSTRKLVIETAKINVLTAYSGTEALESLQRFPNVDGVIVDAGMKDMSCSNLLVQLKDIRSDLPLIVVGNSDRHPCPGATHQVESFNPKQILTLLQELHPEETAEISRRDKELEQDEDQR